MTVQIYTPRPALPGLHPLAMSRPQVGIERLPTRRLSNEPRESMNCKSCRKRKIKCNRLRPACEACQVFQCPCIYDAVPKKRGPKTDVLEALLKRVDGLEARLKKEKTESGTPTTENDPIVITDDSPPGASATSTSADEGRPDGSLVHTAREQEVGELSTPSPVQPSEPSPGVQPDALLDTYFARFHAKPFHILDESTLRQRLQLNQVPIYLLHAISAVAARYTPHPGGYQSAVKLSEEYAAQARSDIDTDEPSVDALQALMLLVIAFTAAGKGKKAYMLLTNAVGMGLALEIHREIDINARVTPVEREMRRRLFWSCYLLDRFMACGSKRPSLIGDKNILLRLPCWSPSPASLPVEGDFFQSGSNLQYFQGSGKRSQGSSGMLIDISRILGTTNRYLAAGGVKGDSHFPWHSLSNLSKIRQDLDIWASGAEDVFSSLDTLFGQTDSTALVLSKLIYHLVHCLIYRPFLPIDLAELAGSGQHQSWQIEATNMCFLHANAIAELVELGKQAASIEWPAFVGYCICTAGTVHIHGAHYSRNGNAGEMNVFSSSADFLSREMQQLSELRYAWASVQHQRETLQGIYMAHSELVKSLANNPMRYAPVFHLEDFFDRYANIGGPEGQTFSFDAANLSLSDVVVDFTTDTYPGHDLYAPRSNSIDTSSSSRPNLKRKNTAPPGRKRPDLRSLLTSASNMSHTSASSLQTPSPSHHALGGHQSPFATLHTPTSLAMPHHELHDKTSHLNGNSNNNMHNQINEASAFHTNATALDHEMSNMPAAPFSPSSFNYPTPRRPSTNNNNDSAHSQLQNQHQQQQNYDPMFGGIPTNAFTSPAPWQGDEGGRPSGSGGGPAAMQPSPSGRSAGTGAPGEEKDPFLSLLEQLAENESALGLGSELDFFLAGGSAGG
ncbi:fungal-specific transcription factor domain-containing protein [Cercophora scortea]|uniref:Fungal-specific transcription factor domain-containing protein n=1 Tax=Cercophora scortea TaxID=314031 RepID=A0AAE0IMK5_9PEZI|nr:fungal-specific transcription factor domain-containing protein [Cercophora scortea]